jgi:polyisoprenoid-binding protein YceI
MSKSTWVLDPSHSEINFKIGHLLFATVSGTFTTVAAKIEDEDDIFETASIQFTGEANSINTQNEERDNHLKEAAFFDVVEYPIVSFVSTKVTKNAAGDYAITGDLTLKGHTQSIQLDAAYSVPTLDAWMQHKIGLTIQGKINRKDFGLVWNTSQETGGMLVGNQVTIIGEMEFIKEMSR